jgi:hypothetical protein
MSTNFTITTYADLERWVDAFLREDGLNLIFLVGNPGTGKSAAFRAKLIDGQHHYISAARLTAFQLFRQLYMVRDKAIILDDVDDPLKRSDMARVLMGLCETDDQERTIAWLGTESLLKVRKGKKSVAVPQEFKTSSRVCIICNDWGILTTKFRGLLDRGRVVCFDPDAAELHRFVGQWFQDAEIAAFIGEHLEEIPRHSIRSYITAADHMRLGLDWKAILRESWTNDSARGNATEQLVRRLLKDPAYSKEEDRIRAFRDNPDGGSRRTWFNIKKKLSLNGKKQSSR